MPMTPLKMIYVDVRHQILLFSFGVLLVIGNSFFAKTFMIPDLAVMLMNMGSVFIGISFTEFGQFMKNKKMRNELEEITKVLSAQVIEFRELKEKILKEKEEEVKELTTQVMQLKKALKEHQKDNQKIITGILRPGLTSEEKHIKDLKTKWHGYYLTKDNKKLGTWIHQKNDFTYSIESGKLVTKTTIVPPRNSDIKKPLIYNVQGYQAHQNAPFVMQILPTGSRKEYGNIAVFPNTFSFSDRMYGFSILQTWYGDFLQGPYILSREPLHGITEQGEVSCEKAQVELLKTWQEGYGEKIGFMMSFD